MVANPYFGAKAREAGLAFESVGAVADHEKLMDDAKVWERDHGIDQVYHDHYYPHMAAYFERVADLSTDESTILVAGEVGAATAAELRGLRTVYLACSPALSPVNRSRSDPIHPARTMPRMVRWLARTPRGLALLHTLNGLRRRRPWDPAATGVLPEDHPIARLRAEHGWLRQPVSPQISFCVYGLSGSLHRKQIGHPAQW